MTSSEERCSLYEHHKLASIRKATREDILRFATFSPVYRPQISFRTRVSIFLTSAVLCLFWYRLAHWFYVRRWIRLAHLVAGLNLILFKANIPPQSCIGPGCFLGHCVGVTFHGSSGRNLTVLSLAVCCPDESTYGGPAAAGPSLGDDVTIGANAVLLGPVTIGNNVRVAPKTRLTMDCAADAIVFSARLRNRLQSADKPVQ